MIYVSSPPIESSEVLISLLTESREAHLITTCSMILQFLFLLVHFCSSSPEIGNQLNSVEKTGPIWNGLKIRHEVMSENSWARVVNCNSPCLSINSSGISHKVVDPCLAIPSKLEILIFFVDLCFYTNFYLAKHIDLH